MTCATSVSVFRSEFDDFLFASIGEEKNGMPLSVVSALARLDFDPWEEAAALARLPTAIAAQRLTSLITALPDWASAHPDAGTIAVRLIALLPRSAGSNTAPREPLFGSGKVRTSQAIVVYVIFLAFMLGTQWIIANRQPSAQAGSAHAAPASSAVSQQISPTSSRD
jgi:hypothetical protein